MKSTYSTGQAVEIFVPDFKAPGMPYMWVSGTVVQVDLVDEQRRLVDVTVRRESGGAQVLRVGPRGGNMSIRAAG